MKLINKDALLAEIERRMEERQDARDEARWNDDYWPESNFHIRDNEDEELLTIINTLEVKEVDLKKEIQDKIYNHFYDLEGIAIAGTSIYATVDDMERIARHFFELGLKAQKL